MRESEAFAHPQESASTNEQRAVGRLCSSCHRFLGQLLCEKGPGCPAQRFLEGWGGAESSQRMDQTLGVVGRNQKPTDTVSDNLRYSPTVVATMALPAPMASMRARGSASPMDGMA